MSETTPAPRALKVKNLIDGSKLKKDVSYTLADLDSAFQEQAALYVEYGRLEAEAARQVNDLELLKEVSESKLYRKLRDDVVSLGKKIVVSDIKEDVAVHPNIIALRRALNEARQIHANTKHTLEAFKQKKDMLVQAGAKDRKEREGELRLHGGVEATRQRVIERLKDSQP